MNSPRGSGTLLALLMISTLCLMALLSWQRLLHVSLEMLRARQGYLRAFHQAESSLAWGQRQCWARRHGECRHRAAGGLRVCLLESDYGYGWLLRGEGGGDALASPLRHYRRVALYGSACAGSPGGSGVMLPLAGSARSDSGFPEGHTRPSRNVNGFPDTYTRPSDGDISSWQGDISLTDGCCYLRAEPGGWLDFDPG